MVSTSPAAVVRDFANSYYSAVMVVSETAYRFSEEASLCYHQQREARLPKKKYNPAPCLRLPAFQSYQLSKVEEFTRFEERVPTKPRA